MDSLAQNNYFFTQLKEVKVKGDSTEIFFDKGKNFNETYVNLSDSIVHKLKVQKDFFTKNLDSTKKKASIKVILMTDTLSVGSNPNTKVRKRIPNSRAGHQQER